MKLLASILIGILVVYVLFVAMNTYLYQQKQGPEAPQGIRIQWGL